MKLTTAQALVKFIDSQYIKHDGKEYKFVDGIFTIFGHGNVLGLGQALEHGDHSLKVYQGKNEQGMALAAMAFAKQNNNKKIMAVTSSIGPGAMNMVTAAACATVNHIPMLVLPGDNFANRQPDPVLQQIEQSYDLTITNNDAFKTVSKFFDRITRPEQLETSLMQAFRTLTDPETSGAVTIALCQDVQSESYEYNEKMFEKRVWNVNAPTPEKEDIEFIIEQLKEAKKPLIVAGGGVKYSLAQKTLKDFCKKTKIPVAFTQAGKGSLEHDFFYNLDGIGVTGNLMANTYLENVDLIIGLGTRYNDFTTGSKTMLNKKRKYINVNVSSFDGIKMDAFHIKADVNKTLRNLIEKIDFTIDNDKVIEEIKTIWDNEYAELTAFNKSRIEVIDGTAAIDEFSDISGSNLHQTTAIGIINQNIDKDAIVLSASGSLPGCMQRMWKVNSVDSYHMEYGYSCMGYEINGALGAKLASPNREVYAFVGDGSFNMLHSELLTAMQTRTKINVMLFDNSGFGCINNLQRSKAINTFRTEYRYLNDQNKEEEFMFVDYAKVASGYGLKTYTVKNEEELIEAVEDAKKQIVSTLIDIKVLPKTMTNGYNSWWDCGVSSVGYNIDQTNEYQEMVEVRKTRN